MRPSALMASLGTLTALFALALTGCKYSTLAGPLPSPTGAPTFPPGTVTEMKIPTPASTPIGITAGRDGNVWFVEDNGNKVGSISPATMAITEYTIPTSGAHPVDITEGPNGNNNLWFDEFATSKIGFIAPSTGIITEFNLPAGSGPLGLTADPAGLLWFAEFNSGVIASISTGGSVTPYPISYGGGFTPTPDDVTIAPDHTVWFLDPDNNVVVHMTFPGPTFTPYSLLTPANSPNYMTVGGDGNLWFTELGDPGITGCVIGRVNLNQNPISVSEFNPVITQPAPDGDWCIGIAKGSDGNIWFAETGVGAVGRITPSGVVTEWGIPGNGTTAVGLANGPDGDLWFTDGNLGLPYAIGTNQIGKINLIGLPAQSILKTWKPKFTTTPLHRVIWHGVSHQVH